MMVKNEAPVIGRCLDSVRKLIDSWVIVDTGSTDGTQSLVAEILHDIPGKLYERPWRDFAFLAPRRWSWHVTALTIL